MEKQEIKFKCPAINHVEHDTIGQTDSRFRRVARSLGLEVCGFMTFDKFFNRKYSALQARLCRTVPNRVEKYSALQARLRRTVPNRVENSPR